MPLQAQKGSEPGNVKTTKSQAMQHTLHKLAALRRKHSVPHPFWIVAAPVVQVILLAYLHAL